VACDGFLGCLVRSMGATSYLVSCLGNPVAGSAACRHLPSMTLSSSIEANSIRNINPACLACVQQTISPMDVLIHNAYS